MQKMKRKATNAEGVFSGSSVSSFEKIYNLNFASSKSRLKKKSPEIRSDRRKIPAFRKARARRFDDVQLG